MFGWFKRKPQPLEPERGWLVLIDDDVICIRDDADQINTVGKEALSGVIIETNDSGPSGAEVWWVLFDSDEGLHCVFPQVSTGAAAAIRYLSALPGFDHGEMIKAMTSTHYATFTVWRRAA